MLAALTLFAAVALGATPAAAWSKNQLGAQQRYLACKAKLQVSPPCNNVWTRHCALMCRARYI